MRTALAILAVVVMPLGCADNTTANRDGGPESGVGGDASTLPSCSSLCERIVLCGAIDQTTCQTDCARSRLLLQPSAVQRLAVCAEKSCTEEPTCTREAQLQCTPLAGAAAVVDTYCNKKKQCDPSTDLSSCKYDFELTVICFSQTGLDRMAACINNTICANFPSAIGTCMAS